MRASILLLLAAVSLGMAAQSPFEFADQRTHEVGYVGIGRAGSIWLVGGGAGSEGGTWVQQSIIGYQYDGSVAWITPFTGSLGQAIVNDMRSLPGAGVLVAGPHDGCDVYLQTSLLMLIDSSGTAVWTEEYHVEQFARLDIADDGRILLSAWLSGLIVDADGDSLTSFMLDTLGLPSAQWSVWDDDSTVMLVRSGDVLERRTLDAEVLATNEAISCQDVIRWNGHRLVLGSNGVVSVLDEDLVVQSTIALGASFQGGRFVRSDDPQSLWVIGSVLAVELDTALTVLQTVYLDPSTTFPDNVFLGFAVAGDTIAMAGAASTAQRPAGIIRTVLTDGNVPVHDENVSIAIQSIDSVWYQWSPGVIFPRANVTVRVTNEGTGIVDSVVVNHILPSVGMCSTVGTTAHLQNLNLGPGDWVAAGLNALWLDPAPWAWLDVDQELCVSVLSPNSRYDRDQSNNYSCDTAHIVLGIAATSSSPPFALIQDGTTLHLLFPSPLPTELHMNVLDMSGRVQASLTVPRGTSSQRVDISKLASGLHVIEACADGTGCRRVKWVKE